MFLVKHATIWFAVAILMALVLACTPGPTDPILQYGDISGYVRGLETQKAIDGASVTLDDQTYDVSRTGIYIFKSVPEGYHMLEANKAGFHPYSILIQVVDNTVHNVYMSKMIQYNDISGNVYLDGSTIPVPDVAVICDEVYDTTDADGYYHLKDITAQTHRLFALKSDYIYYERRVMLESDTVISIYLASARLTGVVTHRLFGPIAGANVKVGEASALTESDGSWVLPTAPQGKHQIEVSHPDYDTGTRQIKIEADGGRHDMFLTRWICDTVPVELDASISRSQFEGCSDCPEWGDIDQNYGDADQLKLEYFLKTEPGPSGGTFVAQTRILLEIPQLPEGAGRLTLTSVDLLLYPVEEYQRAEFVTMRGATLGSGFWEENSVTWADGPRPSTLPMGADEIQPGLPLSFDVMQFCSDIGDRRASVFLQKEELGRADPAQRLSFWSSEASEPSLRPMILIKYSY